MSAATLDAEGRIAGRARAKTKAWRDDEEVFETIVRVAHKAVARAEIDAKQIAALGIGAPGPLDWETGYIIEAVNLRFTNFPLGPRLAELFECPVIVDNDVNAGTYGEFKAGAARGADFVLGVFVGTGIGGGIILNGALQHGFSRNAGEIGHTVIRAGGPRCGCGNRGCLEALASRTAMARDIRKAINRGHKTVMAEMLEKRSGNISSSAIKQAYDADDKVVKKIVRRAARHIGIGIGNAANLLGPQIVVLGGGVIEAMGESFIDRIARSARKTAFDMVAKEMKIVGSELGDDAGVIGAAMLAREALDRRINVHQ